MFALSSACLAIALADEAGTLTLTERVNPRLEAMGMDGRHVVIADSHGIIEIADDMTAANVRIDALRQRRA